MGHDPEGVHVRIAVGDHHPLGTGGRAAGVVDGEQVVLADFRFGEVGSVRRKRRLVVEPAAARTLQRHEVLDAGQIVPDPVDGREVVRVDADHPCAAVVNDVPEICRLQPEVDGHEHRSYLGNRMEGLELRMGIGRDVGDPVSLADPEPLKRRRPPIATRQKLPVRKPQVTVDDGFAIRIEPPGAARVLDGSQWGFHGVPLPPPDAGPTNYGVRFEPEKPWWFASGIR